MRATAAARPRVARPAPLARLSLTRALTVPGWMSPDELRWLAKRAREARIIVEIGSWKGRSTRALADHCPGVVYAIDPWGGVTWTEDGAVHPGTLDVWTSFRWQLRDHLRSGRVRARRGLSASVLPQLAREIGRVVDFAFVDGDHREAQVAADLAALLPLLRPGALLAGHDLDNAAWPGVRAAVTARFADVQTVGSIWWVRV